MASKPGRDVARAAAEVRDRRAVLGLLDETGQQGPVERLHGEFLSEAGRVLLGHGVAASAGRIAAPGSFHDDQRRTAGW
jgi:hypothetical protein